MEVPQWKKNLSVVRALDIVTVSPELSPKGGSAATIPIKAGNKIIRWLDTIWPMRVFNQMQLNCILKKTRA